MDLSDHVAAIATPDGLLVAASDRERTVIVELDGSREVTGVETFPAADFLPNNPVDDPRPMSLVQVGNLWVSAGDRSVTALDLHTRTPAASWAVEDCVTSAAWVVVGDLDFLRYGGVPCAGAPDAAPESVLSLISLAQP